MWGKYGPRFMLWKFSAHFSPHKEPYHCPDLLPSSRHPSPSFNSLPLLSSPLAEFFDYNVVQVNYCDGTSFLGDVEEPLRPAGASNSSKGVYLRGKRIVDAVMWHVMNSTNLKAASQVS